FAGGPANSFLPLTGGTLTGPLILAGDPTTALGAATRRYVDQSVAQSQHYRGGWNPVTNTPPLASGGVGAVAGDYFICLVSGTSTAIDGNTTWNAGDLISNSGPAWVRVQSSGSPYLPLSGGSLSSPGNLTIGGTATITGTTTTNGSLIYTATGGSAARSAQDRAVDTA